MCEFNEWSDCQHAPKTTEKNIKMSDANIAPLVSVVVPAFNPGRFIVDAIESVLAQTHQGLEIIVVDDASTDGHKELLELYLPRIRYVRQEHAGSAVARNRGVLLSRGKYIAFLDADDLWVPDKLRKQVDLMEQDADAILIYSDFSKSTTPGQGGESTLELRKHWKAGQEFTSLLRENFIHTSSVLVRKDSLSESGMFDPMLINAQDWDLWIRLARAGKFLFINEVLSHYRVHESQSVSTLKYARNVVYSNGVLMARFQNDADALPLIRAKMAHDIFKLGRREWRAGNRKAARKAFWQSVRLNGEVLKSLGYILLCALPAPMSNVFRTGHKPDHVNP
jgi:glycosyltransferase involved in cell wall biosynthesis